MDKNRLQIRSLPPTHIYTGPDGQKTKVRLVGNPLPDGRISIVPVGPLRSGEPVGLFWPGSVSPIAPKVPLAKGIRQLPGDTPPQQLSPRPARA